MAEKRSGLSVAALVIFGLALLLLGRYITVPSPNTTFRSERFHLTVTLPPGWAAAEGPEDLGGMLMDSLGIVAFNSWGEKDFWARVVTEERYGSISQSYGPREVLGQLPADGAYIVLVENSRFASFAVTQLGYQEYASQDLTGLWSGGDCRDGPDHPTPGPPAPDGRIYQGAAFLSFDKWGHSYLLQVLCGPDATVQTVAAVNNLLASWRFDRIPAGDENWAVLEARKQLPEDIQPEHIPLRGWIGRPGSAWLTHTEVQDDRSVVVILVYFADWGSQSEDIDSIAEWSEAQANTILHLENCLPELCHWWRFTAAPDGTVTLVSEGGAEVDSAQPTPSN